MKHNQEGSRQFNYQIVVDGSLDRKWADWFDGFEMTAQGEGQTRLCGTAVDQAALHGALNKIHSLGLPLLLVERIKDSREFISGKTVTEISQSR